MVHPSPSLQYSIQYYSTMSVPKMDSSQLSEGMRTTVQYISLGKRHATLTSTCNPRCHLLREDVESSRAAHLQPRMTSLLKSVGLRMVHPTVSFSFRRASVGQRMRTPYRVQPWYSRIADLTSAPDSWPAHRGGAELDRPTPSHRRV